MPIESLKISFLIFLYCIRGYYAFFGLLSVLYRNAIYCLTRQINGLLSENLARRGVTLGLVAWSCKSENLKKSRWVLDQGRWKEKAWSQYVLQNGIFDKISYVLRLFTGFSVFKMFHKTFQPLKKNTVRLKRHLLAYWDPNASYTKKV